MRQTVVSNMLKKASIRLLSPYVTKSSTEWYESSLKIDFANRRVFLLLLLLLIIREQVFDTAIETKERDIDQNEAKSHTRKTLSNEKNHT